MFSLQLLRHSLHTFLCYAASENVLFRRTSSVGRRSLYKQRVFSTCDWLLFLFTIITLRSLVTILWRSYNEFTTKLWRFYDQLMIFQKSGPWYRDRVRLSFARITGGFTFSRSETCYFLWVDCMQLYVYFGCVGSITHCRGSWWSHTCR